MSSVFFYVGILVLHTSARQIPTRFTFPLTSQSVNGSSATGHCTGATRLSDRYQCDDPTSSVVYDKHIPTLTLDANMWASQLLTINASSAVLVFDFTGTPNFQVKRVEMVVFNCPQWGISVQSVILTNSDITQLGDTNPTRSSCDSLVRVCIPILNIRSSQAVLRLEFTTLTGWIHIAEVGFYSNRICSREIIITESTAATATTDITPTTTTAGITTTRLVATSNSDDAGQVKFAAGVAAGVLFFIIVTAVVTVITATACLKRKASFQRKQFHDEFLDERDTTEMEPADNKGDVYDVLSHNSCVQSSVNQEDTYDKLRGTGQSKSHVQVDEDHEVYSQLEQSGKLHAEKLSRVSKADEPGKPEMYAVVNKTKRHKTPSQSTQPSEQEYAVINKDSKPHKPPSQPTQPPAQEYAVINKHRPPEELNEYETTAF